MVLILNYMYSQRENIDVCPRSILGADRGLWFLNLYHIINERPENVYM